MKQLYKFRPNYFFYGILTAAMLFTLTWKTQANGVWPPDFRNALTITSTSRADTTKPILRRPANNNLILNNDTKPDTTKPLLPIATRTDKSNNDIKDTSIKQKVDTFQLKISKDTLEAPLKYAAEDSACCTYQG